MWDDGTRQRGKWRIRNCGDHTVSLLASYLESNMHIIDNGRHLAGDWYVLGDDCSRET